MVQGGCVEGGAAPRRGKLQGGREEAAGEEGGKPACPAMRMEEDHQPLGTRGCSGPSPE